MDINKTLIDLIEEPSEHIQICADCYSYRVCSMFGKNFNPCLSGAVQTITLKNYSNYICDLYKSYFDVIDIAESNLVLLVDRGIEYELLRCFFNYHLSNVIMGSDFSGSKKSLDSFLISFQELYELKDKRYKNNDENAYCNSILKAERLLLENISNPMKVGIFYNFLAERTKLKLGTLILDVWDNRYDYKDLYDYVLIRVRNGI